MSAGWCSNDVFRITHPRFQVRFAWRPGSVAMWDNRQVQHAVVADFAHSGGRRRMERVAVLEPTR